MPGRVMAAVVADDLTGACDAAAPFVAAGCTVTVGLGTWPPGAADVVALSTETRSATPAEAAAALTSAVRLLGDVPVQALFKKVDSRLRGPVGAELIAALRACAAPYCVLAPALPREARVVDRGLLRLGDGPPVDIRARLRDTASAAVAVVPAGTDPYRLAGSIADAAAAADIVVCDAHTDEDLRTVAAAAALLAPAPLLAGTSGLAAALAARIDGAMPAIRPASMLPAARILFVLGSLQPALRRQVERLLARRPIRCLALDDAVGLVGEEPVDSVMLESIRAGADRVDGGATARRLGAVAAGLVRAGGFDAIVCSGGSVAAAVCRELDVRALELAGQLAPGFPLGRIEGPAGPALFALRSGGFGGGDDGLVAAYDRLSRVPA